MHNKALRNAAGWVVGIALLPLWGPLWLILFLALIVHVLWTTRPSRKPKPKLAEV